MALPARKRVLEYLNPLPILGFVGATILVSAVLAGEFHTIGTSLDDCARVFTPLVLNSTLTLAPIGGAFLFAYSMRGNVTRAVRAIMLFECSYIVTLFTASVIFSRLFTLLPFHASFAASLVCASSISIFGILSARFQRVKYLMMVFTCVASAELGIIFASLLTLPLLIVLSIVFSVMDIHSVRGGLAKQIILSATNERSTTGLVTWIGSSGIGIGDTAFYSILAAFSFMAGGPVATLLVALSILLGVGTTFYIVHTRNVSLPAIPLPALLGMISLIILSFG